MESLELGEGPTREQPKDYDQVFLSLTTPWVRTTPEASRAQG